MIYFITGGERSGKSRYAQHRAVQLSDQPIYLATARRWDNDFEERINRHQAERDRRWTNIEIEVNLSELTVSDSVIVLDCITLWLTNIFTEQKYSMETSLSFAKTELNKIFETYNTWIIVSNEIGMGVHASSAMGRKFVELQGWINQYIAERSHEAYFMVSGIPMKLKPEITN